MLNPMPAGRPEPQWTKYQPGSDFEDCEYRVEEREILGVKNRYIMIRGTVLASGSVAMNMPAGVTPYYPMMNQGFVIICYEEPSGLVFRTRSVTVNNVAPDVMVFDGRQNSLFRLFARIK